METTTAPAVTAPVTPPPAMAQQTPPPAPVVAAASTVQTDVIKAALHQAEPPAIVKDALKSGLMDATKEGFIATVKWGLNEMYSNPTAKAKFEPLLERMLGNVHSIMSSLRQISSSSKSFENIPVVGPLFKMISELISYPTMATASNAVGQTVTVPIQQQPIASVAQPNTTVTAGAKEVTPVAVNAATGEVAKQDTKTETAGGGLLNGLLSLVGLGPKK